MNINGLLYSRDFITQEQHDELLTQIDALPWRNDLRRRVQHYGYRYDYKKKRIDLSMKIEGLPTWATALGERLLKVGLIKSPPDQLIVNEYHPGQGISRHVDCVPCFEDGIVSISLGSPCVMNLIRGQRIVPLLLETRSVLLLEGDARYLWMHEIPQQRQDTYDGVTFERQRRVSLTFRKVIVSG